MGHVLRRTQCERCSSSGGDLLEKKGEVQKVPVRQEVGRRAASSVATDATPLAWVV